MTDRETKTPDRIDIQKHKQIQRRRDRQRVEVCANKYIDIFFKI